VLQALREKIRVREIWIVGANRFRNPDEDLPTDFSQKRDTYYEALRQPTEAEKFVGQIKEEMRKVLQSLDGAMPRIRDKVRLLPNRKKKPISITPLAAQPEPRNLAGLKQEVGTRWPMTSLLDMLKETALRTGFPELLTSIASRERLPRDALHRRLILCLYGLGPIRASSACRVLTPAPQTRISATCAPVIFTKSNCAMPSPMWPMRSLKPGAPRSGARGQQPVPQTRKSSARGIKIYSLNGIFAIVGLEF
jgi:hypothetical protein